MKKLLKKIEGMKPSFTILHVLLGTLAANVRYKKKKKALSLVA